MRACEAQVVGEDGELFCDLTGEPCDDGMRFVNDDPDTKLLIGCGDCDPPEKGTKWQGAL